MPKREVISDKVLVLGMDGLDPRLLKKYVDAGKLPNFKEYIDRGACREDYVMLGAQPTVTPAQWTTLGTGAYPCTHGVTDFFAPAEDLDAQAYNFDSRNCMAEPIWNCFAEAGKKTLVFHWPGGAWPPTSDSPNLHVVDGTTPGSVGYGAATCEVEFFLYAAETIPELTYKVAAAATGTAPCVVEGMEKAETATEDDIEQAVASADTYMVPVNHNYIMNEMEGMGGFLGPNLDMVMSPIKEATGWAFEVPEGAKEFFLLLANGRIRRPGLVLKNEAGVYDSIALYKSKKDTEPLFTAKDKEQVRNIIDQGFRGADKSVRAIRNFKVLEIAEDGSKVRMYISGAMDIDEDSVWHPKSLYKEVTENVGYPPSTSNIGNQDKEQLRDCMFENWDVNLEWHAGTLNYLMDNGGYSAIFSHFHALDLQAHMIIRFLTDKKIGNWTAKNDPEWYQQLMEDLYVQQDKYVGKFLHYLDEGWTIILTSDHALTCPQHTPPMMADMSGLNTVVMEQLGYTVLKRDENGKRLREVDWEKTTAVNNRACHIYVNLKGRDPHGIVEPEDKYELEEQIMTDLYGLRDEHTGKRVIALALRNKDAILLGLGGPNSGDICFWTAEGYNYDHTDGLSTTWGDADTSLSPAFIAAGKGIKKGYKTERWIRQVDVVPTVAVLGGVRFPAQCEGAPIYQIFEEEI
ncbi:MAG: alkaline phosphatase family protein [Peptococcaceae bacterium]|nr:alkaline phosphatase family protein [Peptococcaceae bacterium]